MEERPESLLSQMRKEARRQLEGYRLRYGFDFRFNFPDETVLTDYEYSLVSARDCPLVYVQEIRSKPRPKRPRTC